MPDLVLHGEPVPIEITPGGTATGMTTGEVASVVELLTRLGVWATVIVSSTALIGLDPGAYTITIAGATPAAPVHTITASLTAGPPRGRRH